MAISLHTATTGSVAGLEESALRALTKLQQTLPSRLRHRISAFHATTVPLTGPCGTGGPRLLTAIAAACRDQRRLRCGIRADRPRPRRASRTIEQMVASGTLIDPGMVYFDARLSERYPTVEIRIADVCLRAEDAVLIAALARALVETEARSWRAGKPAQPTRTELLRLAGWRASRSGLDDALLHPVTGKPEAATAVVGMLLDHCREALADAGDDDAVAGLLAALLARGNGASFQRAAYRRSGRLADVISSAVAVTGSAG